ncbi:hypothetical protein THRCLA_09960 [Thraustotheca clavata]|uniref:PH domain-containing protein n=1 Tax=Thraustotheca clavata TaxID=74557 RepID=A0A1V9YTF5_9STRA|nr:hypothetical protein THRCLA_09960 [Thraustotheca clavata]
MHADEDRFSTLDSIDVNKPVRDRIREIHAVKLASFPVSCTLEKFVLLKLPRQCLWCCETSVSVALSLGLHGLSWQKERIDVDELLAAERNGTLFTVYYAEKRGTDCVIATIMFEAPSEDEAAEWVENTRILVKWYSRVPMDAQRHVHVLLDERFEHAMQMWQLYEKLLKLAGIECHILPLSPTTYGLGITKDDKLPEALVLVGDNTTLDNLLNGFLQQDQETWRYLVASISIALLPSTNDYFDATLSSVLPSTVICNIIKRKFRAIDAILIQDKGKPARVTCTGCSFGMLHPAKLLHHPLLSMVAWDTFVDPKAFDPYEGAISQHQIEVSSPYHRGHKRNWSGSFEKKTITTNLEASKCQNLVSVTVTKSTLFKDIPKAFLNPSDGMMDVRLVYKKSTLLGTKYQTNFGKCKYLELDNALSLTVLPNFVMICSDK